MKLTKSLTELDSIADELLAKSVKPETEPEEAAKTATPEEIAENTPKTAKKKAKKEPDAEPEEAEKTATDETPEKAAETNTEDTEEEPAKKDDVEKSLQSEFESLDEIKKGMDASEFLTSIVEILSKSLAETQFEVQSLGSDSKGHTEILAKAMQATIGMTKSMSKELTAVKAENVGLKKSMEDGFSKIMSSLEEISTQPAGVRKSVKDIQVLDKNFNKSLNGAVDDISALSKGQVMEVLNQELYAGNPSVTATDIISYESGAPLRASLQSLVSSKCK